MNKRFIKPKAKGLFDHIDEIQAKFLAESGAFFASPSRVADQKRVAGVKYRGLRTMLHGCVLCPEQNADKLEQQLKDIRNIAIEHDLSINGKDGVILREVEEAGIYHAEIVLEDYKITMLDILQVVNQSASELKQTA